MFIFRVFPCFCMCLRILCMHYSALKVSPRFFIAFGNSAQARAGQIFLSNNLNLAITKITMKVQYFLLNLDFMQLNIITYFLLKYIHMFAFKKNYPY